MTDWLCACEVYERARAALDPMRLDLDLREFDEAAAVLSAIWEGLASTARQRLVIADLGDWTKGLRERAIQLLHSARAANKAAQLFRLGPHRTSRDLATILAGIDLARSVGDEVIKFTSPEITASESHDIVARAADTITDLKARGEAIAAEYNIPVSVRPEELRRHAANLRAAGSLWFLSSSVKLASRRYAELRVRPGKKTRRDMAAHMTFIAEHVEAVLAVAGILNIAWHSELASMASRPMLRQPRPSSTGRPTSAPFCQVWTRSVSGVARHCFRGSDRYRRSGP